MAENNICGVAVVGCGTVGGGVATLLTRDQEAVAKRVGRPVELLHVVDVKFDHARKIGLDEKLLTSDLAKALLLLTSSPQAGAGTARNWATVLKLLELCG